MTEVPLGTSDMELARARQLLAAAEHLLASIGRTVRTHDGLRAAVAQHFVKPGHLDAKFSRLLARTAADRNDADYAAVTTFRAEDAEESLRNAGEFVEVVTRYLVPPVR